MTRVFAYCHVSTADQTSIRRTPLCQKLNSRRAFQLAEVPNRAWTWPSVA